MKYVSLVVVAFLALGCSDGDGRTPMMSPDGGSAVQGHVQPLVAGRLVNDPDTPNAAGLVQVGMNGSGDTVILLGSDFAQGMGPGDTELRLAQNTDNLQTQIDANASGVSAAIGLIPNGHTGALSFTVPSSVDVSQFSSVVIWCATAGINFGAAPLTGWGGTLADVADTPPATGGVSITPAASGGYTIDLDDDFVQGMGPGDTELRLATGDGNVNDQLAANSASVSDALAIVTNGATGAQEFALPSSVDPSTYTHLIVWCPTAGVNFGVAQLSER